MHRYHLIVCPLWETTLLLRDIITTPPPPPPPPGWGVVSFLQRVIGFKTQIDTAVLKWIAYRRFKFEISICTAQTSFRIVTSSSLRAIWCKSRVWCRRWKVRTARWRNRIFEKLVCDEVKFALILRTFSSPNQVINFSYIHWKNRYFFPLNGIDGFLKKNSNVQVTRGQTEKKTMPGSIHDTSWAAVHSRNLYFDQD